VTQKFADRLYLYLNPNDPLRNSTTELDKIWYLRSTKRRPLSMFFTTRELKVKFHHFSRKRLMVQKIGT